MSLRDAIQRLLGRPAGARVSAVIDEAAIKDKPWLALYAPLSQTTIYGVVDAFGAGASRTPPATLWHFGFGLIAWRVAGAPLSQTALRVETPVAEEELSALKNAVHADSIVALRGKLLENGPFGGPRFLLADVLQRPADAVLEAALAEARKPVEITDPLFGKLVLDKRIDCFKGSINWLGKLIPLAISRDENGDPAAALGTARALLQDMQGWTARVNDCAIAKLLELKNEAWLDDDEAPLDREQFIARMTLRSISADPEGAFTFWHDDGDLFAGHSIQVTGSLIEGPTDADIPG